MQNLTFQTFLSRFYKTPKGLSLLNDEKLLLERSLEKVFGYYLLQLGISCEDDLVQNSRVSRKVFADAIRPAHLSSEKIQAFVLTDLNYLPFKDDSIDAVLLPHTLESVSDPYHLLRQVDKMLVPEGHVLITGFNPFGCHVIRQKFGENSQIFKRANLVKESRVVDWLNVLGYEIQKISYSSLSCVTKDIESYQPSGFLLMLEHWMDKVGLDLGNVYCIVAKKKVGSPTPVGLNWRFAPWQTVKKGRVIANSEAHQRSAGLNDKKTSQ
ncbi:class I SAM-dependent methyltransferase [Hydrogenovibrio sp. JE_KL2]|uniref:class I SAM-dependent methyltransferase n=1 Tax=Hydrogenovibrio sp. JE_KL2 TaxID=2651188 RepID=UPI00128CC9BF|nr:methyltransferase domain-containing protein [Hydrogenovibrio sp. JE_KL2]MPQ75785.1 class I SAM-dependent methyltransferase [Hydrogenovibrio sp. JE_KL2]